MGSEKPSRGEIWDANLNPPKGHEPGGIRPALIISVDPFNRGGAELVLAIPISSKDKKIRSHVRIDPPGGGLTLPSFAKCEAIRSIATSRLLDRRGAVSPQTIAEVEYRLRVLLGIH